MIKQLAHVCIITRDLKKTVQFYQALGLKPHFKFIKDKKVFGYYLASGAGTFVEVFENKGLKKSDAGALRHICFLVDDLKKLEKQLTRKKIKHAEPKFAVDQSWQMWTEDPNGVKIEFHEYTKASTQITGKDCNVTW